MVNKMPRNAWFREIIVISSEKVGRFCRCVLVMSSSLLGTPRPPLGLTRPRPVDSVGLPLLLQALQLQLLLILFGSRVKLTGRLPLWSKYNGNKRETSIDAREPWKSLIPACLSQHMEDGSQKALRPTGMASAGSNTPYYWKTDLEERKRFHHGVWTKRSLIV